MKLRALIAVCLFSLCHMAFAMPPKPERCPDAGALKSMPFFLAQKP